MLSGETAGGEHPTAAVKIMAATCCEAESALNWNGLYQAVRNSTLTTYGSLSTTASIASSAVKTAIDIDAKAIIVLSETGATAQQIAKFRSGRYVTVLTTSEQVARQCYGVLRGCRALVMPSFANTDDLIMKTVDHIREKGVAKAGDAIVVVHGTHTNKPGGTNIMRILHA